MSFEKLVMKLERYEKLIEKLKHKNYLCNLEIGRLVTELKAKRNFKELKITKPKSKITVKSIIKTEINEDEPEKYKGESGLDTGFCAGCHKPIPFNVPYCLDENGKTIKECSKKYEKELWEEYYNKS